MAGAVVDAVAAAYGPRRQFPWRGERDPWRVLLAEVLLIQTDAARVAKVYPALAAEFPTPCRLLEVGRERLEELLRPLGLYRQRAKRLLELAEQLRQRYGCKVPCDYEELRKLPGVGDYVAATTVVVACGQSAPALDVNIARVLSRAVLGEDPPERHATDVRLRVLATSVEWSRERLYALLDFAAEVCKARRPRCSSCPIAGACKYAQLRRHRRSASPK